MIKWWEAAVEKARGTIITSKLLRSIQPNEVKKYKSRKIDIEEQTSNNKGKRSTTWNDDLFDVRHDSVSAALIQSSPASIFKSRRFYRDLIRSRKLNLLKRKRNPADDIHNLSRNRNEYSNGFELALDPVYLSSPCSSSSIHSACDLSNNGKHETPICDDSNHKTNIDNLKSKLDQLDDDCRSCNLIREEIAKTLNDIKRKRQYFDESIVINSSSRCISTNTDESCSVPSVKSIKVKFADKTRHINIGKAAKPCFSEVTSESSQSPEAPNAHYSNGSLTKAAELEIHSFESPPSYGFSNLELLVEGI